VALPQQSRLDVAPPRQSGDPAALPPPPREALWRGRITCARAGGNRAEIRAPFLALRGPRRRTGVAPSASDQTAQLPSDPADPMPSIQRIPLHPPRPAHFFTVDVEEWFHAAALERAVDPNRWDSLESRVEGATDALLEAMDRHGARGTFFVLGWVARRRPGLVRRIATAGHEVASHGWSHRRVTSMWPNDFRDDVRRTMEVLEDAAGTAVLGYRAPNFSLVRGWEWAMDVLLGEGYRYDSSVFPGRTGHPVDAPAAPYAIERTPGTLLEVPMSSAAFGRARIPAGGAFFRLLPYALTARALRQAEAAGRPGMFYLHPWELDPGQPRMPVGPLTRVRHYGGTGTVGAKLERLLSEFRFTSIAPALGLSAQLEPADAVAALAGEGAWG
jgi:polysaccharide deacetylase family protein (PEP-CTERM system associated)